jgi:hypothetical protein
LTIPKRARAGTVTQTKLLIGPNGINCVGFAGNADTSASTKNLPLASTVDIQIGKDLINSLDEVGLLFEGVTRCNSDAEAFLAAGDGWIINGLNVNVMLRKEFIRRCFGKCCITNKNGYNVGRARATGI